MKSIKRVNVLLEGKIKVSNNEKGEFEKTLKPKEKLLYNKENNVSSFGLLKTMEVAMNRILFKNTKEIQLVKQIKY